MTYSANGQQHATLPSVIAKKCQLKANGMQLTIDTPWGEGSFTSSLLGQFNVSNLLGVIAVLGQLGIKLDQILRVLPQLKTVDGRMQHFGGDQLPTIIVDYAHTPDALSKALHALRPHCQGKLICVFGCGGDRDRSKRAKMAAIAEQFSDHVIVTNDNPRNEDPNNIINDIQQGFQQLSNIQIESDRAQAIAYAVQSADVDDMVLIAGKGHERYQIIKDKILPFDDGQHVQKQLDCRQLK